MNKFAERRITHIDVMDRAKAMLETITPGPWQVDNHEADDYDRMTVGAGTYLASPGQYTSTDLIHEVDTYGIELESKDYTQITADAVFIATAPELVAELMAEVQRLRAT